MPDQITTADMSQHWRIIDATGSDDSHRIHGKWWVSIASIVAIDVCIWDKELNRGRVFYSRDLTAFVGDRRRVELPKHMIASDRLAEAEDAWDLLMAVIQAVADTPWKPLADGEVNGQITTAAELDALPPAEAIADALIRYETSGMCHYGKTCGLCDCGKADEQTQTRDAMELDRARAVLALFPEQRCAPTEEEVARLIEPDAWALSDMEWHDDYGRTTAVGRSLEERGYIRRSANARARNIAKLYADQPTVAQAKADALREAAMDWTDFDAAAMGTPAAWFRARAAAIEKGAHDG